MSRSILTRSTEYEQKHQQILHWVGNTDFSFFFFPFCLIFFLVIIFFLFFLKIFFMVYFVFFCLFYFVCAGIVVTVAAAAAAEVHQHRIWRNRMAHRPATMLTECEGFNGANWLLFDPECFALVVTGHWRIASAALMKGKCFFQKAHCLSRGPRPTKELLVASVMYSRPYWVWTGQYSCIHVPSGDLFGFPVRAKLAQ